MRRKEWDAFVRQVQAHADDTEVRHSLHLWLTPRQARELVKVLRKLEPKDRGE